MTSEVLIKDSKGLDNGNTPFQDDLIELVYQELRQLATSYLRHERGNHTLQPTALVHEAYLRVSAQQNTVWRNREHFIGVAATMMRRILVNYAVKRKRDKRGGGDIRLSLDDASGFIKNEDVSLISLDEALNKFARKYPQQSRIVELRFFGGLSISETAQILEISEKTVGRGWRFARAWLLRELDD